MFLQGIYIGIAINLVFWIVRYAIYKMRKLHLYQGFYPHKIIAGSELLSVEGIIHDVKQLYLHGSIKNLYLDEDYISFEDSSPILHWAWNIYYIKFSKLDELHYRGTFRIYRYNKRSLEGLRAFLSKVG